MKRENLFRSRMWLSTLLLTMVLLFACASNSLAIDASSQYPASAVSKYKGNKYQLVFERMSWENANNYAKSIGGHLATITSADEENHIVSLIKKWRSTYTDSYWLGATDREEEGVWKWTTGESFQYTNWNEGQPDNGEWNDEHYLEIGRFADDTWNDLHGDPREPIGFILEWEGTPKNVSIKLNKTSIVLNKGESYTLKLNGTKKKPKWESSKKSVATVSGNGKVKAKKAGTTKITATLNGKKYECKVTVKNRKPSVQSSIRLNKSKITLYEGESARLKATVVGKSGKVKWKSSDPSVATVNSEGKVTAKEEGTATITAKANGKKATCKIKVKAEQIIPTVDANANDLTFQTTDRGIFVYSLSTAEITFSLDNTSGNVTAVIKNDMEEAVYTREFAKCEKDEKVSFVWDGKMSNGEFAPTGNYKVTVISGTISTTSETLEIREKVFEGGTGCTANPFQVRTLEQFERIEEYNGCSFKQVADISGTGTEQIHPLFSDPHGEFTEGNPFTGTYDGNGFKIEDFVLQSGNGGMALFGSVGEEGCLENIQMENISIICNGRTAGLVRINSGTVKNCAVRSCTLIQNSFAVAGFLCDINRKDIIGCTVENCSFTASGMGHIYFGGFVVDNTAEGGIVRDCRIISSTITVADGTNPMIGGLVRYNGGIVQNCHGENVMISPETSESCGLCHVNKGIIRGCSFTGMAGTPGCYDNEGLITE